MDEPLLPSEAASAAMAASDVESSGAEGPTQPRVASRGVERRASMSGYEMDYEIEEEFFADADKRVGEPRPASGYSSEQLPERPRLPPSYRHPMLNASPKYPSGPLKKQPRRQRWYQQQLGLYSPPSRSAGVPGGSATQEDFTLEPSPAESRCTVYCVGTALQLPELISAERKEGKHCKWYKDGLNAVVYTRPTRDGPEDKSDIHCFYLSYGCIVLWGLHEVEELRIIAQIKRHHTRQPLKVDEVDDFSFQYALGARPSIQKDEIRLATTETTEKLAVSFALSQSAKLGVFEAIAEQTIERSRALPERMAKDGKIPLQRKGLTKRIGQLFVDRASINLHSDILEAPDYFWEDDEYLEMYTRTAKYLEIGRRVEVLNKRLDMIKELFDMLAGELNHAHSNKLEWIVIILIFVEVFFQVIALVHDPSQPVLASLFNAG